MRISGQGECCNGLDGGVIESSERRATLLALLAVALWSTVATGFKLGLQVLHPLQLLLAGALVSTAFFWVLAWRRRRWRLSWRETRLAALLGLMNPFAYYVVLFAAYDRLPAQIAQPLNYTWAMALALLAWPILGQRPSWRTLAGVALGYLGVLVLLRPGGFLGPVLGLGANEPAASPTDFMPMDPIGVALALGSTLIWATYWLVQVRSKTDGLGLMAWSFLFGTAATAVLCALGPGWPPWTGATLAFGAWVGLVEMGVAFLLWRQALALTQNAARIGQLIYLSPLLSFVLIAAVLGERIHPASVLGLLIIIGGLLLTNRANTPSPAKEL